MILQINIYICEVCDKIESETNEVELYSDPLVSNGWDWIRYGSNDKALACTDCLKKYKAQGFPRMESLAELRQKIGDRG